MKNTLVGILSLFLSSQAMSATIDFTKVPSQQAIFCEGKNEANNDSLSIHVLYSPNTPIEKKTDNYATVLFPSEDSGGYIYYTPAIGTKKIADKIELLALLKTHLSDVWRADFLKTISEFPAKYPLTAAIGKGDFTGGGENIKGNLYTISISGFQNVGPDGKTTELTFSNLYFRGSIDGKNVVEVFSGGFLNCRLVNSSAFAAQPSTTK